MMEVTKEKFKGNELYHAIWNVLSLVKRGALRQIKLELHKLSIASSAV
jgi:hypothetical protein